MLALKMDFLWILCWWVCTCCGMSHMVWGI